MTEELINNHDDTSNTSSCSCENHSSVADQSEDMQDLDYDEDSLTDSPAKIVDISASKNDRNNNIKTDNDNKDICTKSIDPTLKRKSEEVGNDDEGKVEVSLLRNKKKDEHSEESSKCKATKIKSCIDPSDVDRDSDHSDVEISIKKRRSPDKKALRKSDNLLRNFFKDACYFQMKSVNYENVELSKSLGVWSTPIQNESRLNAAFRDYKNVILIFSVQQSGGFQGFAKMKSESSSNHRNIPWVLPVRLNNITLGGVFEVEWLCTKELKFSEIYDLHNPFNDNKPIKIARDGQQVEPRVGRKLCKLLSRGSKDRLLINSTTSNLRDELRRGGTSHNYDLHSHLSRVDFQNNRWSRRESSHSQDIDNIRGSTHSAHYQDFIDERSSRPGVRRYQFEHIESGSLEHHQFARSSMNFSHTSTYRRSTGAEQRAHRPASEDYSDLDFSRLPSAYLPAGPHKWNSNSLHSRHHPYQRPRR